MQLVLIVPAHLHTKLGTLTPFLHVQHASLIISVYVDKHAEATCASSDKHCVLF